MQNLVLELGHVQLPLTYFLQDARDLLTQHQGRTPEDTHHAVLLHSVLADVLFCGRIGQVNSDLRRLLIWMSCKLQYNSE